MAYKAFKEQPGKKAQGTIFQDLGDLNDSPVLAPAWGPALPPST